jgi:hypothetical protein
MNYPDDEDGQVLARIAATGMDLSKPTVVEFAIESVDEPTSQAIAARLNAGGFTAEIYFDEGEPDFVESDSAEFGPFWTVYVSIECVPSHANIVALQAKLASLIVGTGAKVEGWQIELQ